MVVLLSLCLIRDVFAEIVSLLNIQSVKQNLVHV